MKQPRNERLPKFLVRIWNFASPSHRRAARERRKDYDVQFEQLKEENLKRVRRMSQLHGHEDMSAFLFDSAHGTGASVRSMSTYDLSHSRPYTSVGTPNGRPFSMIQDPTYMSTYGIPPVPAHGRRTSTASHASIGRPTSSIAPSSLSSPSTSFSNDVDVNNPLHAAASPTSALAGPAHTTTSSRPRPVSMPAAPLRRHSRFKSRNAEWFMPPETTPETEQEHDDYVGGQRQSSI